MAKMRYTLSSLQELPTIRQSQADDLKIETPTKRVWLSRLTTEDGAPYNNMVTVEMLKDIYKSVPRASYEQHGAHGEWSSVWITTDTYEAIG